MPHLLIIQRSTVINIIRRVNEVPEYPSTKKGRKEKLQPRCNRRLLRIAQKNRFKSIPEITWMSRTANSERVSEISNRRCCYQNSIHNYIAVSKPYLSKKHLVSRLNWATTKRNWLVSDRGNVMFIDESSLTGNPKKVNRLVWRKESTAFNPCSLVLTFKSGYVSLSV